MKTPLCTGPLPLDGFSRRQFLSRLGLGLGEHRAWPIDEPGSFVRRASRSGSRDLGQPHFPPKAKRVIYLFMAAGRRS